MYKKTLAIEGEKFEDLGVDLWKFLKEVKIGNIFRVKKDKSFDHLDLHENGLEVKVTNVTQFVYSNDLLVETSITRVDPLFIYNGMVTHGHNSGLSLYCNSKEDELRLHNVYGRGDIFTKIYVFNSPMWYHSGCYNLNDNTETIFTTDKEEMVLDCLTWPKFIKELVNEFHHFM
jgi:hypothetical protein